MEKVKSGYCRSSAMTSAHGDDIDTYDYGDVTLTNRLQIYFVCGGYRCGTLPEAQRVRSLLGGKTEIEICANGTVTRL